MPEQKPIRVFQVLECGGPGGTGEQVAAICNSLDPAKFEATLVYAVRPGASAEQYRARASGAKEAVLISDMTREISPAKDLRAFQALLALFKEKKPDIVHAHSSKAGILARWAAHLAGVPKIFYSPRGYSFQMGDRSRFSRALYRAIEWSVSGIGEIVAVSGSEAEMARPLAHGKPVHVVTDAYLGPLPQATPKQDRSSAEDLRIGACGRLTYARNPIAFVKLAQRITDSRNGVRLEWIGDGEMATPIREMVRDMNLGTRLEITGWLEPAQVRNRLQRLDIFVHFSRWEGLPGAVLEAMAAGLPVVASDIPGNRDAVVPGETGFLVKTEVEALEAVLALIDDAALRRRMGEAGKRRVEREFPLSKMVAALEALYAAGAA